VIRIDLFKNLVLDHPYEAYVPLLKLLQPPATQMMAEENGILYTSRQNRTRQWALSIHDKTWEFATHEKYTPRSEQDIAKPPSNTMRVEYRLLHYKKTSKVLGDKTVGEVISDFTYLKNYYNETIQRLLFDFIPPLPDQDLSILENLKTHYASKDNGKKSRWKQKLLETYGLYELVARYGKDNILNFFREVYDKDSTGRSALSRINAEIRQARVTMESLKEMSEFTYQKLYNELYTKLLESSTDQV